MNDRAAAEVGQAERDDAVAAVARAEDGKQRWFCAIGKSWPSADA